jgi:hypothetical protein
VTGAELIADARRRRFEDLGITPERDDRHVLGELRRAAICYFRAGFGELLIAGEDGVPRLWPWHAQDWRPSDDPVENLVKAGALIAAESDRRDRLGDPNCAAWPRGALLAATAGAIDRLLAARAAG